MRGAGIRQEKLDYLRTFCRLEDLEEHSGWASKVLWSKPLTSGLVPRALDVIDSVVPLKQVALEREVAWASGVLKRHEKELALYTPLRADLDQALLFDEKENALNIAKKIANDVCWSLDLLALTIALIADVEGLEAQKSWISANTSQCNSVAARFFGYWFGVRSERLSNPEGYLRDIERKISAIATDEEAKCYLAYQLAARPIPEEEQSNALVHHATHSILDQYELCVHLAQEASIGRWHSSSYWYHRFLPLMRKLSDPRAPKLAALFGDVDQFERFEIRQPLVLNAYDEGPTPSKAFLPLDTQYEFACRASQSSDWNLENAHPVFDSLKKLFHPGECFRKGLADIRKISLQYPRTSLGAWCAATHSEILDTENTEPTRHALQKFVMNDLLEISVIPSMHEPLRDSYTEAIRNLTTDKILHEFVSHNHALEEANALFSNKSDPLAAEHLVTDARISRCADKMKEVCSEIRMDRQLLSRRAVQTELIAMLELNEIERVIDLVANLYRSDKSITSWLPWKKIASHLDDQTVGELSGNLNTSMACWLLSNEYDPSFQSAHCFAIEGFLSELGVHFPSDLDVLSVSSSEDLQNFLYRECTIETLSLSIEYEGAESVERERIAILNLLKSSGFDCNDECDDEIAHILRAQEVSKAVAKLQKSKISMDEAPLKDWARQNVYNQFVRYRSYIDAGLLPVQEDFTESLLALLEGESDGKQVLEVPDNEAVGLFLEIATSLSREFSLNPTHGLNAFLSLRIRHGTIAGQLRRPCQEQNLLTMVEFGETEYASNTHWFDIVSEECDLKRAISVNKVFADFSREFDRIIDEFANEYVQISTAEKPKGLFAYQISETFLIGLASDTLDTDDFDDFLDQFLTLYWIHLESVLSTVRIHVSKDLTSLVMDRLDNLEEQINNICNPIPPILRDALLRARTALSDALSELEAWFDVPQVVESAPLNLIVLVEVGKEMVCQLHPDFRPNLKVEDSSELRLTGALTLFTDIFFVLFGNVQKHSGKQDPSVIVSSKRVEKNVLEVEVVSDCRGVLAHREAVGTAQRRLAEGDYERDVSREGGSGFYKLAKLMSESKAEDKLLISLDEEKQKFRTVLRFSIVTPMSDQGGSEHAIVDG